MKAQWPYTVHGAYWWNQNLDGLSSICKNVFKSLTFRTKMSLCHLKSYILVVCHWKIFPKCAFSSACGSAPTYSWAFRSLEGVSKNSRRNLGTSEFRRLLNSSSASLATCFAQLGQICSARCATRLVGPSSLPVATTRVQSQ